MVVDTKYGEFECKDITRKDRRRFYKRVKEVFAESQRLSKLKNEPDNLGEMHELGNEFALLAFGDEQKAEEALGKLSAVEEDEVLVAIIGAYMGVDLGNPTGD